MPLIILPNFLTKTGSLEVFPAALKKEVEKLEVLIAESEKSARRYLVRFVNHEKANALPLYLLNEHTGEKELLEIASELKNKNCGLISDAGMPVLADPGARLIFLARRNKVPIKAILGPSSIFQALVLSGLPAQSFSFEGYLPREEPALIAKLQELEKFSLKAQKTIMFIEAPYRNQRLLEKAFSILNEKTIFAAAVDLMDEKEEVIVASVKEWKKKNFDFRKRPAVFLLYAGSF